MVGRSKKRCDAGPNREKLRVDKDTIVYRRSTREPVRYVPQIYVARDVSVLDLLDRNNDKDEDSSSPNNR